MQVITHTEDCYLSRFSFGSLRINPSKEGILQLYIENAASYIQHRAQAPQTNTISRTGFEVRILTALDKSSLDIQYKFAWYNAILNSGMFDAFWYAQRITHHLSEPQTERYIPDPTLCSYRAPPSTAISNMPFPESSPYQPPPRHHLSTHLSTPNRPPLSRPALDRYSPLSRDPYGQTINTPHDPYHRTSNSSPNPYCATPQPRDPYDRAAATNGFQELINLDLGPAEAVGARKRKKSAKAMALSEEEWERGAKKARRGRGSAGAQVDGGADSGVDVEEGGSNVATVGSESGYWEE